MGWRCKKCHADREMSRKMKIKFGMTWEDWSRMASLQKGACAICKRVPSGDGRDLLHLDHDHQTGRPRALLCRSCNFGIGFLGDRIEDLLSAIEYLRRWTGT